MLDRRKLKAKMVRFGLRFLLGQIVLIFIPAGSFAFWQGWAYLELSFILQFALMIYFYRHDPQVLARRLLVREKNPGQKIIIVLLRLVISCRPGVGGSGLSLRLDARPLFPVPIWLTVLALLFIVTSQYLFFRILQANRFAASIIQVETGQTIAAAGPYRFIRHPMYLAMTIHWLAVPLALGSIVALAASIFIIPVFHPAPARRGTDSPPRFARLCDYCRQVRYRLVPFVW